MWVFLPGHYMGDLGEFYCDRPDASHRETYEGCQPDVWTFIMEIDILGFDLSIQVFQHHGSIVADRPSPEKVSGSSLAESLRTPKRGLVVTRTCNTDRR